MSLPPKGAARPNGSKSADRSHLYPVRALAIDHDVGRAKAKGSEISFDRSWGRGESALPGPAELLASAFAACVIKNVERFSQLLPFEYEGAEIDVEIRRVDSPPRFDRIDYVLTLTTDEPSSRVQLLHRNLEKHGTVFNTLASVCDVAGRVEVEPTSRNSGS